MLLAIFAAASLAAGAPRPLPDVIAHLRETGTLEVSDYDESADLKASAVIAKAAKATSDLQQIAARVARALSIPPAAAAALSEAQLRWMARDDQRPLPEIDAAYASALREAPANRYVLAMYARYKSICCHEQFAADVLPRLRSVPPAVAVDVAESVNPTQAIAVLAEALGRAPHETALLESIVSRDSTLLSAALGPVRLAGGRAELRPEWKGKPTAAAAMWQLGALMDFGFASEALAALDALPAGVRAAILNGSALDDRHRLLPLSLAGAAFVGHDEARARSLLAAFKAPARSYGPAEAAPAYSAVLRELLAAKHVDDPFDLLEAAIASMWSRPSGGVWANVLAQLAERGGYPRLAQQVLETAHWPLARAIDEAAAPLPAALRDDLAALRVKLAQPPEPHTESPSAIEALLRAPRIVPFVEKPMPATLPAAADEIIDCSKAAGVAKQMSLPAGLYPLRMERRGSEVAAIALARMLDPMGEVGIGAYWILHSTDGGTTWEPPLYTGLREHMPYAIVPSSKLPLLAGDRLHIEVLVRELDTSSITFPPVDLRVKREARGLYLDLPWAELRRDSDGDGVTDLVEERIGTDPHQRDSDGIDDGKDGFPQIALTAGQSAESEALAALLRDFHLGAGALVEGVVHTEEERNACVLRASAIGPQTLFLVGDRAVFSSIDINRRIVVFTPHELALYVEKFGPTYAGDMSWIFVNHAGTKALVIDNESWRESVFELNKTENGWVAKTIGGWIS